MIMGDRDMETEKVASGRYSRRLPQDIQRRVKMRLDRVRAVTALDQLPSPPSHHLEALAGDRSGQHSNRINDQWRICFEWRDGHAHEVEIVDYH